METSIACAVNSKVIKLSELSIGTFKTLKKITPSGALVARKQLNGTISFFWRYSIGNKSERVLIGVYDPTAPPKSLQPTIKGYSTAAATREAEELAMSHYNNKFSGGRPAQLQRELLEKENKERALAEAAFHTLENMLNDYSNYLEALGRTSHRDTRSIFALHVIRPFPQFAKLPANTVSFVQITDMIRRTQLQKKGRTANKLRSYLRAAYEVAKAYTSDSDIPEQFKVYNIEINPVANTSPVSKYNKADKNPLNIEEIRLYWHKIRSMPGFIGAVLRFHLLTGAQRIEQLVQLRNQDIKQSNILLIDKKGRPGQPAKEHLVPLTSAAALSLNAFKSTGEYALSTDGGTTHLAATTLSAWAKNIGSDITDFRTKRIRSGVETLLSEAGISAEICGRLQSHGISGVQNRHYNGNKFLPEKLMALETLYKKIDACEGETNVDNSN